MNKRVNLITKFVCSSSEKQKRICNYKLKSYSVITLNKIK